MNYVRCTGEVCSTPAIKESGKWVANVFRIASHSGACFCGATRRARRENIVTIECNIQ